MHSMANHLDLPRADAEALLAIPKAAPEQEWELLSGGKIEKWRLAVGVITQDGEYRKALAVELLCLKSQKPFRECYKFSLFRTEFGTPRRAYQLDTTSLPLCDPGDHDWPHEHVGHDRISLGEGTYPDTFEAALDHFSRRANIVFDGPPQSPFAFHLQRQ